MEIDMIEAYGTRVIEGIPIQSITTSGREIPHGIAIEDKTTGVTKYLHCVRSFFLPSQSYYKVNEASDCSFCRKAMDYNGPPTCLSCFQYCANNREIKKQRLIIKPPL
jgi:hypothetical protein